LKWTGLAGSSMVSHSYLFNRVWFGVALREGLCHLVYGLDLYRLTTILASPTASYEFYRLLSQPLLEALIQIEEAIYVSGKTIHKID
jgi:hypothetical protein